MRSSNNSGSQNVCVRTLQYLGPRKTGVWTLNVDLEFSTFKVREKWVCADLIFSSCRCTTKRVINSAVLYKMDMYTVYMIFFNLHHSGTQLFLGNVDTFVDPKLRQLHSAGG